MRIGVFFHMEYAMLFHLRANPNVVFFITEFNLYYFYFCM